MPGAVCIEGRVELSLALVEATKQHRAEVKIPDSVVDLFQADVLVAIPSTPFPVLRFFTAGLPSGPRARNPCSGSSGCAGETGLLIPSRRQSLRSFLLAAELDIVRRHGAHADFSLPGISTA